MKQNPKKPPPKRPTPEERAERIKRILEPFEHIRPIEDQIYCEEETLP